jgi:pilus assembly protein CpaF
LHAQLAAALQVVVHLRRAESRRRIVEQVCLLLPDARLGLVGSVPAWHRSRGPGPAAAALVRLLHSRGVAAPEALGGRP